MSAVRPGETHTPMLQAGVRRVGKTIADLDRLVPLGRIGRPKEAAAPVAFLAYDEASFIMRGAGGDHARAGGGLSAERKG